MSALLDSSSELARVQVLFEQWRARRSSPRQRMPAELWDAALSLLDHLPLPLVARSLGLASQQLRRQRDRNTAASTPLAAPARFLDLPRPAITPADIGSTAATSTARLVLERADGARLSISIPVSAWDRIDAVVGSFLADSR